MASKTTGSDKLKAEHETKYVFANNLAPILIKWMKLRCLPDPKFPSGMISSIYYDTKDWLLLNEKINSDYLKTKFRVRWYESLENGQAGEQSFIEIKHKIGAIRKKIRIESNYSGNQLVKMDMADQALLDFPKIACAAGANISLSLYPAFQISYKRFRFLEPKTRCRLCIDYDIRAPRANWRMLPRIKPLFLNSGVIELKGNISELPDTIQQLTALGCRKQSFSKYSSCYYKLTGLIF